LFNESRGRDLEEEGLLKGLREKYGKKIVEDDFVEIKEGDGKEEERK
jgi:hypothetical protein